MMLRFYYQKPAAEAWNDPLLRRLVRRRIASLAAVIAADQITWGSASGFGA
jgi:hypothetical protein